MRAFLVDTAAMLIFFTAVAMFTEIVIAGLTLQQSLAARAATVPVVLATGRAYGIWRDLLFAKVGSLVHRRGGKLIADTAAFVTFNVPVYIAVLVLVGARPNQMVLAVGSAIIGMIVTSRPYGIFLDAFRRAFGTAPAR